MPEPMLPQEVEDLLFSYAAGALDEAARVRVEALLDADPGLRERLRWYESVCEAVIDELPEPPALPSTGAILQRIRPPAKETPKTGWGWWRRPAAAALIVVQAVAIGVLLAERRQEPLYRSIAPAGDERSVVFVVAFHPDTPEAKVRALLVKAGATIVDGPKQLGEYSVSVPANRAQYAQRLFEDSGITEYVRRRE